MKDRLSANGATIPADVIAIGLHRLIQELFYRLEQCKGRRPFCCGQVKYRLPMLARDDHARAFDGQHWALQEQAVFIFQNDLLNVKLGWAEGAIILLSHF